MAAAIAKKKMEEAAEAEAKRKTLEKAASAVNACFLFDNNQCVSMCVSERVHVYVCVCLRETL